MKLQEIKDFDRWMSDHGPKRDEPSPKVVPAPSPAPAMKHHQRHTDTIVREAYRKLRDMGLNVSYTAVLSFLMGGGSPVGLDEIVDFLDKKFGWVDGWSTWEENEKAFTAMGISKQDLTYMADVSNGEIEE